MIKIINGLISKYKFLLLRLKNAKFIEIIYRIREFCFYIYLRYIYKKSNIDYNTIISYLQMTVISLRYSKPTKKNDGNNFSSTIADLDPTLCREIFFWPQPLVAGFDIRLIWEIGRLQNISKTILQPGDGIDKATRTKEIAECKTKIISWLANNPFPHGPHYTSAMECGLRLPVFFYALKAVETLDKNERQQLLCAIYQHAWYIANRLSLYSSCGNHTVCEALGLVFAGAIFLPTEKGKKWLRIGIRLLEQELPRQVLPDGGPLEQAIKYHRFVLDAYWLVADFLTKNNLHYCSGWLPRLRLGEQFLQAFSIAPDTLLSIGDSDDGHIVAPGMSPARETVSPPAWSLKTFPDSGYTVVRGKHDLVLTFDHGPLGMPPLYAHGHADALSITLSLGGKTILVDPGTYRYNGVPEWRHYFKSTRAHNTVTIDGLDQAVQETSFIWSHPYEATLLAARETPVGIFLAAQHNGYARLPAPLIHRRHIYLTEDSYLIIHDTFHGEGVHTFELNFHLHPQAKVRPGRKSWEVSLSDIKVLIFPRTAVNFRLVYGQKQPILGWYSEAYGQKVACPVLTCQQEGRPAKVEFLTGIYLVPPTSSNPSSEVKGIDGPITTTTPL